MLAGKGVNIYFTSYDKYDDKIGGIRPEEYQRVVTDCKTSNVQVHFRSFDLTKKKNVISLYDDATSKLGSIDILVNCLCYHCFDTLDSISASQLNINFNVNSKAVFLLCQEFYKRFTGTSGRIVNLSSTQSLEPLLSEISYAISKASTPVIVSTLAPLMARKGITINAVNPGATEIGDEKDENINQYRENNPFGRIGFPTDAANIVYFLVSDEGKWISGQTINSEGGQFRGMISI